VRVLRIAFFIAVVFVETFKDSPKAAVVQVVPAFRLDIGHDVVLRVCESNEPVGHRVFSNALS